MAHKETTMAKDQTSRAMGPDLAALRAAVDQPAREQAAAEQAEAAARQRTAQTAVAAYAAELVKAFEPVVTAWAAWQATQAPTRGPERARRFGPELLQALDRAIQLSHPLADLAAQAPAAARVADEVAGAGLLPPEVLAERVMQLDSWAARLASWPLRALGWTRARQEAADLLAETAEALAAHERWVRPTAEALAALAEYQQAQRQADAAPQPPPPTPKSNAALAGAPSLVREPRTPRAPAGISNLEDLA
jgi:hypothetical protein